MFLFTYNHAPVGRMERAQVVLQVVK